MSLSDDDLNQIYDSLAQFAHESKLDWVVSEVARQVSIGQVTAKDVRPSELETHPDQLELELDQLAHGPQAQRREPKRRQGRSLSVVVSEEYTPKERALLLLDALKTSVAEPFRLAVYLSRYIRDNLLNTQSIEFHPDEAGGASFVLDERELATHEYAVKTLVTLLTRLEEVIRGEPARSVAD